MYARNTIQYNWLSDVKVIFFGPSERLLDGDKETASQAQTLLNHTVPVACKYVSDQENISDEISTLGVKVDYVGKLIASLVRDDYVPMVW